MDAAAMMNSFGLRFNPFPPAATGTAFINNLWLPDAWTSELSQGMGQLSVGAGEKAATVVGPYGSGKTYVLNWLMQNAFQNRRIRPYLFDNPGVALYDLANQLLRQVGRIELSKGIWEISYRPEHSEMPTPRLIQLTFPEWLRQIDHPRKREREMANIAASLRQGGLVEEDEVAYRFAQLAVDTRDRPHYEFREFLPRSTRSYVAEGQEARYFKALTKILRRLYDADGIAFLIDEFEDITLGKRLAQRQASEYTATLRRLLDAAQEEDLWLVLSITPEGLTRTRALEPALIQRFSMRFTIPPLTDDDVYQLVKHRLNEVRDPIREDIWPFDEDSLTAIEPTNRSTPRRLIRVLWRALSLAVQRQNDPPIPRELVAEAERLLQDES